MLFRHRKRKEMEMQQDSHEDLSCMSCYGNHSSCGCDRCGTRGCPGPVPDQEAPAQVVRHRAAHRQETPALTVRRRIPYGGETDFSNLLLFVFRLCPDIEFVVTAFPIVL